MIKLLTLLCLLAPSLSFGARAVMEGIPASRNAVYVTTAPASSPRVYIATRTYSGAVSNVGLFTSSNVVISDDGTDKIVLYATGAIAIGGNILSTQTAASLLTANNAWTGTMTVTGGANFYIMVSSADPVGSFVTTVTIPSPFNQSSVSCHVDIVWFSSVAVTYHYYVNGDRSLSYSNAQTYHSASGVANAGTSGVFDRDRAPLIYDGDVTMSQMVIANSAIRTTLSFETLPSNYGTRFVSRGEFSIVTGGWYPFDTSVLYNNASAAINTITIVTNNSPVANPLLNQWPFTGHWELWCKGFSHR